ncbi:Gastricsin (Pepsinogen C) [Durusdinium trenchii]|uniref:Gastricsin (Pepsinogen C) n=1 Tax=Durusdinium trenchii TaxID=1381693 RepID=A0ABP0NRG2_9DINO
MPIDGIVGLGFEALSVKTKPLMDSLLQENALPLSEFAFFLYKDVSKGGVMIWGNAQQLQLHQEPLQWFPVAQEKYWSLLLRGFRLGRNSTNDLLHLLFPPKKRREDGSRAVEEMPSAHLLMDSGTTFFTAPPRLFNEISRFIWPSSHHLQRFPELVFTVGTDLTNHSALAELVIPPEVYMVRSPFDHSCVPGIMNLAASPEDDPPMMILGEVFMRHRFSIYRRGRVQGDSWVWIGNSSDMAHYVHERFGKDSVALLFMDHRGSLFHDDLRDFEEMGLLKDGAMVVADNVLKPGAPYFLWRVTQSPAFETQLLAVPEFGLGHQAQKGGLR